MTIETSFIFIISLILLWIKPGPGQAMIVTRALNDGFMAGFSIALGIVTGSLFYFLISAIGAVFIENYINQIGLIFKLIGSVVLFRMGYRGLKDIGSGQWSGRRDQLSKKDMFDNYMTGLVITLANPFVIFFFVGILPSLVPLGDLNTSDIVIGALIVVYVGCVTDGIIAALAAQVRTTLSNAKTIRKINMCTSIGFILIGSFLLFSAITSYEGGFAL
jgi:threonine/homoserine/homoserine lactone efflux protein